jgi:anti-sigma-K factor RskA
MQSTNRTRVAALWTALVAAVLIAAAALTPAKESPVVAPVAKVEAQVPIVGTFTGEFDNGVPVYRLPPITMTASRSAELAKIAREDQFAMK